MASLLSLDVAGAFDNILYERLLHNLKVKGIPSTFTAWTVSFLSNRATSITLGGRTSPVEEVRTGIPQGSPVSPILFLFFNTPLIEEYARAKLPVQVGGFVDDIHLLTYSKSTEANCRQLEQAHKICQEWARTYGATFALQKYELVHLTRTPRKYNMAEPVKFEGAEIDPNTSIRVLGLQIDSKLRWGPHITQVKAKAVNQARAIKCLTGSTWGATFLRCRAVYNAVVRPILTFAAPIWHRPKGTSGFSKTYIRTLETIQNTYLRSVLGAYKATPVQVLEAELQIPPIEIYLDRLTINYQARRGTYPNTLRSIKAIQRRLRGKRGRKRR